MYKKQLLVIGIVSAILLIVSPVFASGGRYNYSVTSYNILPEPRLLYPINDKVILTGKDPLEFRWMNNFMGIDHFIIKIYKGYNMYESFLVYKQKLPMDTSSIKIKSDFFVDGQVYTWSLIQVSLTGQKSDQSFNSFRINKR